MNQDTIHSLQEKAFASVIKKKSSWMLLMRMMMKTTRIREIGYNPQVANVVSWKLEFLKNVTWWRNSKGTSMFFGILVGLGNRWHINIGFIFLFYSFSAGFEVFVNWYFIHSWNIPATSISSFSFKSRINSLRGFT